MAAHIEPNCERRTLGDQCHQDTLKAVRTQSTGFVREEECGEHSKETRFVRKLKRRRFNKRLTLRISQFPVHLDYSVSHYDLMAMGFEDHIPYIDRAIDEVHRDLVREDPYLALKDIHDDLVYDVPNTKVLDRMKLIEILVRSLMPMTFENRLLLASDRRLWSECTPWFVGKCVRVLLDGERLHIPDYWGQEEAELHSGDNLELRPSCSYVAAVKKPQPQVLIPRVHPAIRVSLLNRDERRALVRTAEVEGLICRWCGVVNFPKYGHLPLCLRPLTIPYDTSGLFDRRHWRENVDLHGLGVTHTVRAAPEVLAAVNGLQNIDVNVKFANPLSGLFDQVHKLFSGMATGLTQIPSMLLDMIRNVPVLALWVYNKLTKSVPEFIMTSLKFLWRSDPSEVVNSHELLLDPLSDFESWDSDSVDSISLHAGGGEDALFVSAMAFLLFPAVKAFWTKPDLKKLISTCVVAPKLIGSWSEFAEWFCDRFMSVLSLVTERFGVQIKCKRKILLEVQAFHDMCIKFSSASRTGELPLDYSAAQEYQRLEMMGCDLYVKYSNQPDLRKALAVGLRELREVGQLLTNFLSGTQGMRVTPLVTAIAGQPGIGKSVMLPPFCNDILRRRIPKWRFEAMGGDLGAEIYTHNGGDFWDGYHGQELMLIDDAFQKKVVAGMAKDDYNDFIKLVSCAPMPLAKADLMSKGRFHFCSKGIVLTTNNVNMKPHVIQVCVEVGAMKRRLQGYEFVLKDDFKLEGTEYLNHAKFVATIADKTPRPYCTPDAWDVYEAELVTPEETDAYWVRKKPLPRGVYDVIDRFVAGIETHTEGHQSLMNAINQWSAISYSQPSDADLHGPSLGQACAAAGVALGGFTLGISAANASQELKFYETEGKMDALKCWLEEWKFALTEMLESPFVQYGAAILLAIPILGAIVSGISYLFRVLFKGASNLIPGKGRSSKSSVATLATTRRWFVENLVDEDFVVPGTDIVDVGPHVLRNAYRRLVPDDLHACALVQRDDESITFLGGEKDESQMVTSVVDIVERNTYHLSVRAGDGQVLDYGTMLFVAGNVSIMNKHFVLLLRKRDPDDRVILRSVYNRTLDYELGVGDFLTCVRALSDDTDVAYLKCVFATKYRDLTTFTLTKREHLSIKSARAVLVVQGKDKRLKQYTRAVFDGAPVGHSVIGSYRDVWCYTAKTQFGDCGSVLVMTHNPTFQNRRFLGFHMGMSSFTQTSLAVAVSTEMINHAKEVCGHFPIVESDVKLHSVYMVEQNEVVPLPGSFIPYKRVLGQFHPMATRSNKIPVRPMVDALRHIHVQTRKPAHLRPFRRLDGVKVDPNDCAYAKLAPAILWRHKPTLFRAVEEVKSHLRMTVPNHGVGILTPQQALEGVKVEGCWLEPINRSSGPGFPYCLSGSEVKSKRLMTAGPDGISYVLDPGLVSRIETIVEEAKAGRRCEHIYVDFLKDELRPIAKADEGKSRLISSCPLDLTLVTRMYFGAFVGAMMAYCSPHHDSRVTVGINPFDDWDPLVRNVMRKGANFTLDCPVIAGDFSGFDATEIPEVHDHILDIINAWYDDGDEAAMVRRVLWLEVTQSRHLTVGVDGVRNIVVEWIRSLPSGHPLTSLINSIYNMITFVYCFNKRAPPGRNFFRDTKIYFYGDDNWGSVDPEVRSWFNQRTIQEDAIDLGLKYTDDSKSGDVAEWQRMGDTQFLKRTAWFDEQNDRWFGALDINSTIEICCWTRSLEESYVAQNIERTMYELSFSPLSVWNKYAPAVTKAVGECFPAIPAPGCGMDAYKFWRERARQYGCHF